MMGTATRLSLYCALVASPASALTATPGLRAPAVRAPLAAIKMSTTDVDEPCGVIPTEESGDPCQGALTREPPFSKVMAANRAEIAVRIMRASTELNMATVAIYGFEDRYSQHRWGADQSFMLDKAAEASPISAYLDIDQIIKIAKEHGAPQA